MLPEHYFKPNRTYNWIANLVWDYGDNLQRAQGKIAIRLYQLQSQNRQVKGCQLGWLDEDWASRVVEALEGVRRDGQQRHEEKREREILEWLKTEQMVEDYYESEREREIVEWLEEEQMIDHYCEMERER
jgi:hypothetical protein